MVLSTIITIIHYKLISQNTFKMSTTIMNAPITDSITTAVNNIRNALGKCDTWEDFLIHFEHREFELEIEETSTEIAKTTMDIETSSTEIAKTTMFIFTLCKKISKPRRRNKSKKNKGWSVVSKPVSQKPKTEICLPKGWTKNDYRTYKQTGKFVNMTVILKNLPKVKDIDEYKLKMFFTKYAGPIVFVNPLRYPDGTCKGIAFIRFRHKGYSDKALSLNRFTYNGEPVYVEYANDRRNQ